MASTPTVAAQRVPTPQLISAMLQTRPKASDLIFSPGRPPQVEVRGELVPLPFEGFERLQATQIVGIAEDLVGANRHAAEQLTRDGSTDISYALPGIARFRVNIFRQRGTCAIVMRVIPMGIPSFDELNLPAQLDEIVGMRNGIVLVTGPTGSGKSSTLAAIIGRMNERRAIHVVTIEDPIEFLHEHKMATIHQRELHNDTPTFALALRAALRQAPKVILVGEMRDRETIEIAVEAAETGHLVLSTLHTIDASKTVERIVGAFPLGDQAALRNRLSKSFQFIVSQRLLPRADAQGRVAVLEILKSTLRTREYIEKGEGDGKTLLDAMRDGKQDGMQHFDGEMEKLLRARIITLDVAMSYATNPNNLRLEIADFVDELREEEKKAKAQAEAAAAR
jgi:twitching motility protein PilT